MNGTDFDAQTVNVNKTLPDEIEIETQLSQWNHEKYQLKDELGRGASGRVLLATDSHIGREIAVKELLKDNRPVFLRKKKPGYYINIMKRFLREARITGQLEHPSIIPVHEIGVKDDGTLYYTMRRIQGKTFHQKIKAADTTAKKLKLLPHFIDVCNAVAYAHSMGVIHRDIKPDNIMVGPYGETFLVDWGIAKAPNLPEIKDPDSIEITASSINSGVNIADTIVGSVIGTPSYMPPEQAAGKTDEVDERSDIYSLGAVLYRVLTGSRPFASNNVYKTINETINGKLSHVLELNPEIPPEIAEVAMKALSKKKEDRYNSASEITDEITSWMSGGKVSVYNYSSIELLKKFYNKNKRLSIALVALTLVIISALTVVSYSLSNEKKARLIADNALHMKEAETRKAHYHMSQGLFQEAKKNLDAGFYGLAMLFSASALENNPANPQSPYFSSDYTKEVPESDLILAKSNSTYHIGNDSSGFQFYSSIDAGSALCDVKISPDGKTIAAASENGHILLFNINGKKLSEIDGHKDKIFSIDWSSNGFQLISGSYDGSVALWDFKSGKLIKRMEGLSENVYRVSFFDNDSKIISSGYDGKIRTWDVSSGKSLTVFGKHKDAVYSSDVSPDGKLVISADYTGKTLLWNVSAPHLAKTLEGEGETIFSVKFSPSGKYAVAGGYGKKIFVYSIPDGKLIRKITVTSPITSASFNSNGNGLTVSHYNGDVSVFSFPELEKIVSFPTHKGIIWGIDPFKDDRLATAGYDGKIRLWKNILKKRIKNFAMGETMTFSVDRSKNGVTASGNEDGTVTLVSEKKTNVLSVHSNAVWNLEFSSNSKFLATASIDKSVAIIDVAKGKVIKKLNDHQDAVYSVNFSKDSSMLVTASLDGTSIVYNTENWKIIKRFEDHSKGIWRAVFSPDMSQIASVSDDFSLKVWSIKGSEVRSFKSEDILSTVNYSSDGKKIFVSGKKGTLYALKASDLKKLNEFKVTDQWINYSSLSADSSIIALSSNDNLVRILSTSDGQLLFEIKTDESLGIKITENKLLKCSGSQIREIPLDHLLQQEKPKQLLDRSQKKTGLDLKGFKTGFSI